MLKKSLMATAVVVAIAGSWAVLDKHSASQAQTTGAMPAPEVSVAKAITRPVSDGADFTGQLQAVDAVNVRPRVNGYINKVFFTEGAVVHQGDVLFQIDPRPFQAEVDRLDAARAQAAAQLKLAVSNDDRAKKLIAEHAISQAEADSTGTAEDAARATLAANTAALASARLNLDWTQVRAPIDGRVSNARIMPGNLVDSSNVLTSVVSVNPVYVYFDVDEHAWLKIDRMQHSGPNGQRIDTTMGLADENGYPHQGHIDFIDNQMQSNAGTIRLRAVFDNENGLLTPGLYARVHLEAGTPRPRILIDDRAVGTDLGNQFVYVVGEQNKVEYRKVTTGALVNGLRVIEDGLHNGDEVVVDGLPHVRPGIQVKPDEVAMTARLTADQKVALGPAADGSDARTAQTQNAHPLREPRG